MNNTPQVLDRQSVQEHEPKESLGYGGGFFEFPTKLDEDTLLSQWGAHKRDRELRNLYRNQFAWLAQSCVSALVRKVTQTPWQLQGGRNLTTYFQGVLQDSDFHEGWTDFWSKVLLDFLTCDYGAYIEIIGSGRADKPLRGRVLGIAHLDSLRCVPTGNLEYPVVYWSRRTGQMHRMHYTRVYRLVDMVDGDEQRFGVGLCALSRAISVLHQTLNLMKYTNGQLADIPANGVLWLPPGLSSDIYTQSMQEYKNRRDNGYKGAMAIGSPSSQGSNGNQANFMPFSMAPDGFNYEMYIDIAVNAFSAAFGIDRQDIFPLQGRMSGTATQSQILFEKAKGMAFGDLLSRIKRMMNTAILPPSLEFDFEYRDEEKDKQVAERTSVLLDNATKMRGVGYSDEAVMQYLANQDENLRDVTLDENGDIISLPDDDVLDASQTETEIGPQAIETDADNQVAPDDSVQDGYNSSAKDITDTQTAFMQRFNDVYAEARAGNINRRRAGILIRGMLRTFIGRAYGDGLEEGGVPRNQLDNDDSAIISQFVMNNSQYVSNLTDVIYHGDGVTDAQAESKAIMWYNKSIAPAYDAGRLSANANGMYEWKLGATEQHCVDCSYMSGQIHRLKTYIQSGWHPKSSKLACMGFRCECELIPRPGARSRGRMRKTLHIHTCSTHNHELKQVA